MCLILYSLEVLSWASWYYLFIYYLGFTLQAVAYIPAFLEDRAAMIKERANGLYGVTSFLIANVIIGIPFLCTTMLFFMTNHSFHLSPLLLDNLLAHQSPVWTSPVFQLSSHSHTGFSRRRIPRRPHLSRLSDFRCCPRTYSLCKWSLDDCWGIPCDSHCSQRILEVHILSIRLPAICFFSSC